MIPTPEDDYDLKVPGANDFLAVSQEDFLSNFGQLYNAFVRNHVALDAASSAGNHTNVQLVIQGQGPATNVGELSLYSKSVVNPTQTTDNLFLRYQGGNPAGTEVQMTTYQLYNQQNIQPGQFGLFTYLPGGLILYFGVLEFSSTSDNSILLSPKITKNVIAANLCASGNVALTCPWLSEEIKKNGIVEKLIGHAFVPGVFYFYIVLGNT